MNREEDNIKKGGSEDNFEDILMISSKLTVPSSSQDKEAAWNKLMNSIELNSHEEAELAPLYVSRKLWYSVAATLLIIVTASFLTYKYSMVELQLSKGQVVSRFLPDSSEVVLNADSKIDYRRYGWLANREILLNGEAFFSVKHGNQFAVITNFNRKVIVTGTKFNVLARGEHFEVKCFDGSVVVQIPSSKPISLTKGTGISIDRFSESPSQIALDSIAKPAWIIGEYYFSNAPLNLVLDEFGRQFNITVITVGVDLTTRNYTGFFKRTQMIQALDLICIPMDLSYVISSDSTSVIIKK